MTPVSPYSPGPERRRRPREGEDGHRKHIGAEGCRHQGAVGSSAPGESLPWRPRGPCPVLGTPLVLPPPSRAPALGGPSRPLFLGLRPLLRSGTRREPRDGREGPPYLPRRCYLGLGRTVASPSLGPKDRLTRGADPGSKRPTQALSFPPSASDPRPLSLDAPPCFWTREALVRNRSSCLVTRGGPQRGYTFA